MLNQTVLKLFVLFSLASAICLFACKAKKKIGSGNKKQSGVSLPFDTKEFKTDTAYFRARGAGNDLKLETAKKLGLQNAASELDTVLQKAMSDAMDQYVKQAGIKDEQGFINQALLLVSQLKKDQLNSGNVLAEKIVKEYDNTFTYWTVVEINKHAVIDAIEKKSSSKELAFDKVKFEKILNEIIFKLVAEK